MYDPNKGADSNKLMLAIIITTIIGFLLPFLSGVSLKEYFSALAMSSIGYGVFLLFVGLILIIFKNIRFLGQAFLISCIIHFILSFSLCSSGIVKIMI